MSRAERRRNKKWKESRERNVRREDEELTRRLPPPGSVKLEPLAKGQQPTAPWVHQRALMIACNAGWKGCKYVNGQLRIPVAYFRPYAVPDHPTKGPVRMAGDVSASISGAAATTASTGADGSGAPSTPLDTSSIIPAGSTGLAGAAIATSSAQPSTTLEVSASTSSYEISAPAEGAAAATVIEASADAPEGGSSTLEVTVND